MPYKKKSIPCGAPGFSPNIKSMISSSVHRAASNSDILMLIPFDEIVSGATVRLVVIDDTQYLSIRDLIMHLCDTDGDYACQIYRNLSNSVKKEVRGFVSSFKFPGRGQQEQAVITCFGTLKLIMKLPGEAAKQHRTSMVTILQKYFAGDPSLLTEVEANAASDSVISRLARASLATGASLTASVVDDGLDRKRKRELEDTQLHDLKVGVVTKFATTMDLINPSWRDDTRLRLKTEDWLKNAAFNNGVPAITNGGEHLNKSISVSQVAQEMGYTNLKHGHLIKLGLAIARKYRDKYDTEAPTHLQWVDGAERKVKSYTERDREMIEEAIAESLN